MTKAAIMFGGNLPGTKQAMDRALLSLQKAGFEVEKVSPIYRSPAEACVLDTPDFLDQAIIGQWTKSAEELLTLCQNLERTAGRPEKHRSDESRILDCDLICFGNECRNTPFLTLPHPRAKERLFVLLPLAEIAPELLLNGVSVALLLQRKLKENQALSVLPVRVE